jgi:hypothetical protein
MRPHAEKNNNIPIQENSAFLNIGVSASNRPEAISSEALSLGS